MALIRDGGLMGGLSGAVGTIVFSRNKGGNYIRNRTVPTTSTTTYAMNAKAIMTAASQAWQGLTAAQRASWNEWSAQQTHFNRIGQTITLPGNAAFNGIFSRLTHAGETTLTAPPISPAPAPLVSLSLEADIGAGDFDLTYTATPLGASESIWLDAAIVGSPGINFVQNMLRFVGISAAAQASPYTVDTIITARFGTPIVGQKVIVMASVFDSATGLLSQPQRAEAIVTTT